MVVADLDLAAARATASAAGGVAAKCDVTSRRDVEEAVETALAFGGSLDSLVA